MAHIYHFLKQIYVKEVYLGFLNIAKERCLNL